MIIILAYSVFVFLAVMREISEMDLRTQSQNSNFKMITSIAYIGFMINEYTTFNNTLVINISRYLLKSEQIVINFVALK